MLHVKVMHADSRKMTDNLLCEASFYLTIEILAKNDLMLMCLNSPNSPNSLLLSII